MPTRTQPRPKSVQALSKADLLEMYRLMLLSRRLDDREIQLKRQNKIFFQISGAGHEGVLVAAAKVLRPAYDWFYTYYRDRALCLGLGMTPTEQFLSAVGAADDPNSGGRQMPSHWGHKDLNIVSASSPTGTQFLQAVGCAEAWLRADLNPAAAAQVPTERDEVVLVTTGDGSTSKLMTGFPNLLSEECDGCDVMASYDTMSRAVEYARQRKGPALVHAKVIRPYSHSLSDDEILYRPPAEREAEAKKDPLVRFPKYLVDQGVASEAELEGIRKQADEEVEAATATALAAPQPAKDSVYKFVYSPDVD